jgi:trehalose 6-phosphate phosphatase
LLEPTGGLLRQGPRLYPCVVISGRAHADVQARLCGAGLAEVIGNHGVEPWASTTRFIKQVAGWQAGLRRTLSSFRGVVIENKALSVAIHYRQSREKKKARLAILAAVRGLKNVRVIGGKQVVNVLPVGAPHKGIALERARAAHRCDTAIFVGDDETDEDVFTLDQPGQLITIRVGSSRKSAATYCLRNQHQIDDLLRELVRARTGDAEWRAHS